MKCYLPRISQILVVLWSCSIYNVLLKIIRLVSDWFVYAKLNRLIEKPTFKLPFQGHKTENINFRYQSAFTINNLSNRSKIKEIDYQRLIPLNSLGSAAKFSVSVTFKKLGLRSHKG